MNYNMPPYVLSSLLKGDKEKGEEKIKIKD
jgi:hypothetical protein